MTEAYQGQRFTTAAALVSLYQQARAGGFEALVATEVIEMGERGFKRLSMNFAAWAWWLASNWSTSFWWQRAQ